MRFIFTSKRYEISDELRNYAEKKVGKLEKYFKGEPDATIVFCFERGMHKVEITLRMDGMFFRSDTSTSDVFASIDMAISNIERQIRKNKTRISKRLKADILPEVSEMEEETEFEVIKTKKFSLKPISVDEAILQMNLLGHSFYMFKGIDEKVAVVYKRNDGGYGLITEE